MNGKKHVVRAKLPNIDYSWLQRHKVSLAFGVILLVGFIFRSRQYLTGRSLWLDEAFLAVNILERTFLELLQPLDYSQGAPIGFLWVQKLISLTIGSNEYALRLIPFLSSLLAIILFAHLSQKLVSKRAALLATIIFALSMPLINYASEAKQYSSDVLISLLGLSLLFHMLEKRLTRSDIIGLSLAGVFLLWFSHPSVFVLASSGSIVLYHAYKNGNYEKVCQIGLITLLWGAAFAIFYFISLRQLSEHNVLLDYWQGSFPPSFAQPRVLWSWLGWRVLALFRNPAGFTQVYIALFFYSVGVVSLGARNKFHLAVAVVPILLTLLASFLHKYPFGDRLLLFLTPFLFIILAEGVDRFAQLKPKITAVIVIGLLAFLLYSPLVQAVEDFVSPLWEKILLP